MTANQSTPVRSATAYLIMSLWQPRCDANRNAFPVLHAVRIYSEPHPNFMGGVFGAEVMQMPGEDFMDASNKLMERMTRMPEYRWMLPYVRAAAQPDHQDDIRAAQRMFGIKFNENATDVVAREAARWFDARCVSEIEDTDKAHADLFEQEGRLADAVRMRTHEQELELYR